MVYIAHRGNVGPATNNHTGMGKIETALSLGYDVEIDLRYSNKSFWIGHDKEEDKVSAQWLIDNILKLWCHCKNRAALAACLEMGAHCFWHQTDDYTLTSKGCIWAYPGEAAKGCILVLPELLTITDFTPYIGICSDQIEHYKHLVEENHEQQD
jgi:hypothetical protein